MEKKLAECKPGEKGVITGYVKNSNNKQKLLAMGLTRGTMVEVLKLAPMGDPIEIRLRDFNLSLRKSEAEDLFIKLEEI